MSIETVILSDSVRHKLIAILKSSNIEVLSEDLEDVVLNGFPGLNNMTDYDLVHMYEYIHSVNVLGDFSDYEPHQNDPPDFKFALELMIDISTNRMLHAES